MKFKIGTDIEQISRIKNAAEKNPLFFNRVFTENEICYIKSRGDFAYSSATGIFCAKEAFSKALGTGFSGFGLKDVEILHKSDGSPYINPMGRLSYLSSDLFSLSVSHSGEYATASVIYSGETAENEKNKYVLSASQMKSADNLTSESVCPSVGLMKNAADALFSVCERLGKRAVILCGKGNNGGDGVCLASLLKKRGRKVSLIFLSEGKLSPDSEYYFNRLEDGIEILTFSDETEDKIRETLKNADFAVDCLFGTGFSGNLPENAVKLLSFVNCYTVACDLPSGVNADSGTVASGTKKADETVTFAQAKLCHYLFPSKNFCGKITVSDIGISEEIILKAGYTARVINESLVKELVPERPENSNKGTFGTLCVSCGSPEMPGAALLALKGAMASGVGLCAVSCDDTLKTILLPNIPEAIYKDGVRKENAVLIGCGIGKNITELEKQISKNLPTLFDADALNMISENPDILKKHTAPKIMTPHPLEMARLMKTSVDEIEKNRFSFACKAAEKYNATVLLKGRHTVIASLSGEFFISEYGNSGLAKGGSGDVLAGFIAGLLASGFPPVSAAVCGVYAQGKAADFLKGEKGERGYSPSDIPNIIGKFLP